MKKSDGKVWNFPDQDLPLGAGPFLYARRGQENKNGRPRSKKIGGAEIKKYPPEKEKNIRGQEKNKKYGGKNKKRGERKIGGKKALC